MVGVASPRSAKRCESLSTINCASGTCPSRGWPAASTGTSRPMSWASSARSPSLEARPSARIATPSGRPRTRRLMIAASRMSAIHSIVVLSPNSSGINVTAAPTALPMPSARKPAFLPIVTTTYQRGDVCASCMRFETISAPTWRAVAKPNVGTSPGSGRSLSMVFGTCTTRSDSSDASARNRALNAVSSPPIVSSPLTSSARSLSHTRATLSLSGWTTGESTSTCCSRR